MIVDISALDIDPQLIEECGIYWLSEEFSSYPQMDISRAQKIKSEGGKLDYSFEFIPWDRLEGNTGYRINCGVVVKAYLKLNDGRRDTIFGSEWRTKNTIYSPIQVKVRRYNSEFAGENLILPIEIDASEDIQIDEYGVFWGIRKVEIMDVEKEYSKVIGARRTNEYFATIKGIAKEPIIYFIAYASVKDGLFYSYIDSIRAPGGEKTVSISKKVEDTTECSAIVSGSCSVTNPEMFPITERGFCYCINDYSGKKPTIWYERIEVEPGSGNFSATITGLKPSTEYIVRAYAINVKGVTYSNEQASILTKYVNKYIPEIELISAEIDQEDAGQLILQGTVLSDKGYYLSERGFCYTKDGTIPTTGNPRIIIKGGGIGDFSIKVDYLSPGHYTFRAYGITSLGVGYSKTIKEIIIL